MRQLSVESVPLFEMFQTLFKGIGGPAKLKEAALAAGASEETWTGFMQYVLNFYGAKSTFQRWGPVFEIFAHLCLVGNMGNYKSFGDTKFVVCLHAEILLGTRA